MSLRIYPPEGNIRITAPHSMPLSTIQQFVSKKRQWILVQQQRIHTANAKPQPDFTMDGPQVFMGEQYQLIHHDSPNKAYCLIKNQELHLYRPNHLTDLDLHQLLHHAFKPVLLSYLHSIIPKWEAIIKVKVNELGIKFMKTRWGSCNTQAKRIWISLTLIKKPLHCIEYVLVHEMVHLLEPSHNQRFYQFMSKFLPNWKSMHEELNNRHPLT